MEKFTDEELSLLLDMACNEAQKYADKGKAPPKNIYDIRYKLRDIVKNRNKNLSDLGQVVNNSEIINKLTKQFGEGFTKDFQDLMVDAEVAGLMEIVDKPEGRDNNEEIGVFEEVWVDLRTLGMPGDSFVGEIYAKFGENKWLKVPYKC